jgi:HTH-type transcriptional regulator / antitoxin HipB
MIHNERQYEVTETKLRNLERDLAEVDRANNNLHPRKALAQRNSLTLLINELRQELAEYDLIRSNG